MLTVNIGEKYPVFPVGGGEKELFQHSPENSAFLKKTGPQEKVFYQSLTLVGEGNSQHQPALAFYLGEGKTPVGAHLAM